MGNFSNLSDPGGANQPFQELVQRVQEIQEFANDGGQTIDEEDIFDTIYTLVYNTGLFYENCDKCSDRQCDEKNWADFQAHFQVAQRKFKRKQKVSTHAEEYHGANNLREMDGTHDALINLSTAAVANIDTMMTQFKTIADLTATVAALNQQLQQANAVNNRGSGTLVDRHGQANPKWVNDKRICDVGGYCWTHGHCMDISHDSMMCRSKKEVHRDNATRGYNLGGNHYSKPRA